MDSEGKSRPKANHYTEHCNVLQEAKALVGRCRPRGIGVDDDDDNSDGEELWLCHRPIRVRWMPHRRPAPLRARGKKCCPRPNCTAWCDAGVRTNIERDYRRTSIGEADLWESESK
jgi:hypothetical protein